MSGERVYAVNGWAVVCEVVIAPSTFAGSLDTVSGIQ